MKLTHVHERLCEQQCHQMTFRIQKGLWKPVQAQSEMFDIPHQGVESDKRQLWIEMYISRNEFLNCERIGDLEIADENNYRTNAVTT